MITLEMDRLVFRFPEVHPEAECRVEFQRTLRIPDDGKDYYLPPGLGRFPLRHLDDFASQLPPAWQARGGVIMPMYQSEAMWINFSGDYPFAIKIAAGKINAVSGEEWKNGINRDPQDYVVIPGQPWLDGFCVEKGLIRQFVAMPLGEGYTAEEQITGEGRHGGVQVIAYPMKAEAYNRHFPKREYQPDICCMAAPSAQPMDMGLAPGGRMKQEIYEDPYRFDEWDLRHASRCFVTIANSVTWKAITGEVPPTMPPTAAEYSKAGMPWFDYYGADLKALGGALNLQNLKSVASLGKEKWQNPLPENESVENENVLPIRAKRRSAEVREGDWRE